MVGFARFVFRPKKLRLRAGARRMGPAPLAQSARPLRPQALPMPLPTSKAGAR